MVTGFPAGTADAGSRESVQAESGLGLSLSLLLLLLLEELLQDADDAAGLGQVAMLRSGVLQQHVTISAALQELAAAEQGIMARLRLTYKTLQAVHVLNGLWSGSRGEWKTALSGQQVKRTEQLRETGTQNHCPEVPDIFTG